MTLLTPKVMLSALAIVTMVTGLAFAQQYTSQVNRSVASSVVGAVGELPQYEVAGFPISPHQISVLGSGDVQEKSLSPMLTLNGMPASPHQIAVIGPRSKQQMVDKLRRIWN